MGFMKNRFSWKRDSTRNSTTTTTSASAPRSHRRYADKQKQIDVVCKFWAAGNCRNGDGCRFLHSWFRGDDISIIAHLQGHTKAVTGIVYPSGGDKLYSGSKDGAFRIWKCHTAECQRVIDLGGEIGCLLNEGPWIFVGLPNSVKAWNIESGAELSLDGPKGQVYALAFEDDILFAGTQSGQILAWKLASSESRFSEALSLEGHNQGVMSLTVGLKRLYSGSLDGTINVLDIGTMKSEMKLKGHSGAVTSMLCWSDCLLSCSLDGTIKAWYQPQEGVLKVRTTHKEEQGVIALSGMNVPAATPEEARRDVLFVSCRDNTVHLYELPSVIRCSPSPIV